MAESDGRRREESEIEFRFRVLSQVDAEAIAHWHYPDPFSFYDFAADPDDLAELLDPTVRGDEYVAVEDGAGSLAGFFQYKRPRGETLEIGLGLHPERTGQGLGEAFLKAGLEYARRSFAPKRFSLSVASFNRRAMTVYERVGFVPVRVFTHSTNGGDWEFVEMQRPAGADITASRSHANRPN
jgi:ribosomal-protein-alanine N-acetyltransferase